MARCRTYVRAAAPQLVVIDASARIARDAHARGQLIAIGSNASRDTVAAGLATTGLGDLFDTVVTRSDVPADRGKPAPDIVLLAAQRLGVRLDRCLVSEDTDTGVAAAPAAGMTAYNVRTVQLPAPDTEPVTASGYICGPASMYPLDRIHTRFDGPTFGA